MASPPGLASRSAGLRSRHSLRPIGNSLRPGERSRRNFSVNFLLSPANKQRDVNKGSKHTDNLYWFHQVSGVGCQGVEALNPET